MPANSKIGLCLWFDDQAEAAAKHYVSIFKGAKITQVTHYGEAGREQHRRPPGSVMTVAFDALGMSFTALNAGPQFKFNEAVSIEVFCENQAEIDDYWDKLGAGGDPKAQICGWLKDKYGVSWQIVPTMMRELFTRPDDPRAWRAMRALMDMKKLDIAKLKAAYEG